MFPTLYRQETPFGEVPYNTWGLMITLAFLGAAVFAHRRSARVGLDPDKMVGLYVVAIVGGLLGARLLHFLMATPEQFFADPMIFFRMWQGGFAFYGGFIVAGIGGVLYARSRGMDPWKVADVVGPVVMLGLAIGRIGCFAAGCCHGKELHLPSDAVAVLPETFRGGQLWVFDSFPFIAQMTREGVGHNDLVVYPTQLWEAAAAFAIFGVTSWMWRHARRFDGQIIAVTLLLYSAWRPVNESMRGDEIRGTDWFGLTTSQLVSVPVAVLGLLILALQWRRGVAAEEPFEPAADELIEGSAPRL